MTTGQDQHTSTFGNEAGLPRVPLPTIEASCTRFLDWCAPLLTPAELAATEASVREFLCPDGPARVLHADLERFATAEGTHSWLDEFWPYRYLGRRDRIALNANFFFLFTDAGLDQVDRAAALIAGALAHKHAVDTETLPPETSRGRPLSMEQHKYLFSATRIPGVPQDTVRMPYTDASPGPSTARHIVVLRGGRMFRLEVIGPAGRPHTVPEIAAGVQAVLAASADPAAPGTAVGHLTSKARAEWAADRQALLGLHPRNAECLETIETALFCLCLDDLAPAFPAAAADALLHGGRGNRWFDKAVSLVAFADGTAGFNGEHANLDGTVVVSLIDAMLGSSAEEHSRRSGALEQGTPVPAPLEFVLDDALRASVQAAAEDFAGYADATAGSTLSVDGITSETPKKLGCSPDAFAQLAFQLAHRRARGRLGATYESIATRHFHHGRTEAMRVVTPEIVRFVTVMEDPDAGVDARRTALRAAAERHVARAKECQSGRAPEQHLWELALIQARAGDRLGVPELPELYRSPGWVKMRDDSLSTSAVPSEHVQYFGFGSTSHTCIGVGYALLPTRFDLYLATPRAVTDQMHRFADALPPALAEMADLLDEV